MAIRQNKEDVVVEFLEMMYVEVKAKHSEDAGIKNVIYYLIENGIYDGVANRWI